MSDYKGIPHKRTLTQNAALHRYFELLAKNLNEQGITIQIFLKHAVDLDWNARTIKEIIWKPIQKFLLDKKSTTELNKVSDIDEVFEHIHRHISQTWGLMVEFPHRDPNDIAPTK